jgi:hypothetical protein
MTPLVTNTMTIEEKMKRRKELLHAPPTPKNIEIILGTEFIGYEDKEYTLPDAITHCKNAGGVLASAGEVALYKQKTKNDAYFHSRTVCLHHQQNKKPMITFYDDIEHNIILTRTQEGYNAHNDRKPWSLPLHDPDIAYMLAQGRTIPLPKTENIATNDINTNTTILTMLGTQGAKAWQEHIQNTKHNNTKIWFLDNTPTQGAEIRLLGVGSNVNYNLIAYDDCNDYRRCVAVRKKSPRETTVNQ